MADAVSAGRPLECQGYIRQPTVGATHVVFVAEDDIWMVDRRGGLPRRLTAHGGAHLPLLSPCGGWLAFSVSSDVWVCSLKDVRPRRLTWFGGGTTRAVAWVPQDRGAGGPGSEVLVISSTAADPYDRPALYRVQLRGGQPELMFEGEFDALVYEASGPGLCLGRHTLDPVTNSRWKGYRGGKSGFLWLDRTGHGPMARLPLRNATAAEPEELNVSCAMWILDRIWFVADPDGPGNLWSVSLDGQDLKKHTEHGTFDVRDARSFGDCVVYTCGAELWILESGGAPRMVPVEFGAPMSHLPQYLDAGDECESVLLHPDGHHCACLCRGQVFEMPLWEGPAVPVRCAGPHPGRAVRCLAMEYLYSGRLLTVTDELLPLASFTIHPPASLAGEGKPTKAHEWVTLLLADAGVGAQHLRPDRALGSIHELVCSPAHDALLAVTGRNELLLIEFVPEVGAKPSPQKEPAVKPELPLRLEVSRLDGSDFEEGISGACWSPDGEWVAYARKDARYGASIVLLCLETRAKTVVAESIFENFEPCFSPDGRFLSFFSCRTFAPLDDHVTADMGFPCGSALPYLILLQKDLPNPFKRVALSPAEIQEEDNAGNGGGEAGGDEADDEDGDDEQDDGFQPPEKVQIDLEGLGGRLLQFPVAFGNYSCGSWTDGGKFQYLRGQSLARQPGTEDDDSEDTYTLFAYSFTRLKEEQLAEHVLEYQLSMDLKNMILKVQDGDDEEYRVHVAGEKLPTGDDEDEEADLDSPGPESGILDIGTRISLEVVPEEEWAQIFDELCHHVRENYFDEDLGGVSWETLCAQYRALLPRLRSRSELTDLCSELLAELGVSHISVSDPGGGGEDGSSNMLGSQGQLGVQVSWQEVAGAGAYKVESFTKGDVWDVRYSGPLARAGVGISEGAYIIAVNRTRVSKEVPLEQMLANLGGTEFLLTFVPPESAARFAQVQGMLHKAGGPDGFRKLNASSRKGQGAPQGQDKRKRNKKAGGKAGKKAQAARQGAEAEQRLSGMLEQLGVDVNEGPIWRTVRVRTADMTTRRNAALRDLVEDRLRHVHASTGSRVGYVHIPDTCELGFAEFYRYFSHECDREALILDLRCNGGGYATELFLKQLRNIPMGWSIARPGRGRPEVAPQLCTQGRMVLLIDENTSSDGECWAEAFKRFGMGKVVGVRTWGGVVSVGGADVEQIDGGELSIPYQHYFVPGLGFALENRGVDPDIAVEWPPRAVGAAPSAAGAAADPQLAEAIRQARAMLEGTEPFPPNVPRFPPTRLHLRGAGAR